MKVFNPMDKLDRNQNQLVIQTNSRISSSTVSVHIRRRKTNSSYQQGKFQLKTNKYLVSQLKYSLASINENRDNL